MQDRRRRHRHAGRHRAGIAPGRDPRPAPAGARARAGELRSLFAPAEPRRRQHARSASRSAASSPACTAGPAIAAFYADALAESGAPAALQGRDRRGRRGGQDQGPVRPLSRRDRSAREDTAGPCYRDRRRRRARARPAAGRGVRARAHAGLPSARCRAALPAGAARRRLVHHRHRDALPARRLPVLPDPGRRRTLAPS